MIDQALDFICKQVNAYLCMKLNIVDGSTLIQLANISWNDSESTGSNGADRSNAFISLVNIEEDRISKSPQNYVRSGSSVIYKNPKIFLSSAKPDRSFRSTAFNVQLFNGLSQENNGK